MVGPRTLRVPLLGKDLKATGDKLIRSEVALLVRSQDGWQEFGFRVDTGAEMTCMPAAVARLYHINYPTNPTAGIQRKTASGPGDTPIRVGALKIQVKGLEGREFFCPCSFIGDPALDDPHPPGDYLLALTGILRFLRLIFDGAPSEEAPFGSLIVEETSALPRKRR
jgi:hypothetical protein